MLLGYLDADAWLSLRFSTSIFAHFLKGGSDSDCVGSCGLFSRAAATRGAWSAFGVDAFTSTTKAVSAWRPLFRCRAWIPIRRCRSRRTSSALFGRLRVTRNLASTTEQAGYYMSTVSELLDPLFRSQRRERGRVILGRDLEDRDGSLDLSNLGCLRLDRAGDGRGWVYRGR